MINRNDDHNEIKNMMLFCVAAVSAVLLLFLIILVKHEEKNTKVTKPKEVKETVEEEFEVGKSNFESGDLDFWEMYDEREAEREEDEETEKNALDNSRKLSLDSARTSSSDNYKNRNEDPQSSSDKKNANDDRNADENHVKVIGRDGKPVYYEINEKLDRNSYNFSDTLAYDNGLLKYSSGGSNSLTGIDISGYDGTIDFSKVKSAGVDYAMIRVGTRGFDTGLINLDEKFAEYTQGASAAGLPFGLFFTSNAISEIEAVEEANYAIAAGMNYNVKYPVAVDISSVSTESRTDKLTKAERTAIIKKFCDTVKAYGRTPAICASRDFLITELNLEELTDYDVWLKDEAVTADYMRRTIEINDGDDVDTSDGSSSSEKGKSSSSSSKKKEDEEADNDYDENKPDYIGTNYPYQFTMWQYTRKGTLNGMEGSVNLNMSFVNYVER